MAVEFVKQLSEIVEDYESAKSCSNFGNMMNSDSRIKVTDLQTRCISAIERVAGQSSNYYIRAMKHDILDRQIGVVKALISDIQNGYLVFFEELAHSNVFSDYIEMSEYLLDRDYKDAAAVIAGSTLEVHLRLLCTKNEVSTEVDGKNKMANVMNEDLAKKNVYKKLDQKSITSWIDLRNNAAHGNYDEYDKDQVKLQIAGIRNFIARYPA